MTLCLMVAGALASAPHPVAQVAPGPDRTPAPTPAPSPTTIVVTGTRPDAFDIKSNLPPSALPQSVQVLTPDDLIARGARSIGEALRDVPSANVGASRVARYQSTGLRLRGFAADQMRNGIRQRYYEDVDASALSNVARIDVLKGPSATLFGQSGVGGILSIVTKQPTPVAAAEVAVTAGNFGNRMVTLDVGGPVTDTLGIRLTGEVERSGSFVDLQRIARENIAVTLAWRPAPGVSAHLVGEYIRRATVNNPGLPVVGTVRPNGTGRRVARSAFLGEPGFAALSADAPLVQAWVDVAMGGGWTITPRYQYSGFNTALDQIRLLVPAAATPTRIPRNGRRGREADGYHIAQLDLGGAARLAGMAHELTMGVEYSAERPSFVQSDIAPGGVPPIDSMNPAYVPGYRPPLVFAFRSYGKVDGFAAYVQDRITPVAGWSIVAGLRRSLFDYENVRNGVRTADSIANTSGQLGTTVELTRAVQLFGGYNRGFDVDPVVGARSADGRPFLPETSDQVEAGVRLATGTLRASAAAFRIRRDNVAVPDPQDPNFQIQEGRLQVRGVEVEGAWTIRPGWSATGGYAYLDGRVARSSVAAMRGARLGDTPGNTATLRTEVAVGPVVLRASGYHAGDRRLVNGSAVVLPGYWLGELGLGAEVRGLRIDAALTNVTDRTYYTASGGANFVLPGDPRTFVVRVSQRIGGGR